MMMLLLYCSHGIIGNDALKNKRRGMISSDDNRIKESKREKGREYGQSNRTKRLLPITIFNSRL